MTSKTEEAVQKVERRRLTTKQWTEAETLWELGEVHQIDLARKYKISEQAVHMHMKRNGIVRGAKAEAHKKKVAEEVVKASIDDSLIIAGRIRETKEEHYKMASGIAKLAWAEILKAKQDGSPIAVATNNLKALDAAMNVMLKARTERWVVLGLDRTDYVDEEGLPELLISELTADEIELLQRRDHTELDDIRNIELEELTDDIVEEK